jgi:pimeloyl-ACP methyl ester carboxylesterase
MSAWTRALALLIVAVLASWSSPAAAQILGAYIQRGAATSSSIIIFIHGLTGNARETWLNPQSTMYWPHEVARELQQHDVFVVDYVTSIRDGATFAQLVTDIDGFWKNHRLWNYENVTLVAHSLGGLIARQLILRNAEHAPRIKMMYLLATPSGGSRLANYATSIGVAGPIVKDLRSIDDGSLLATLANSWNQSAGGSIPTYCGVEGRPTAPTDITGATRAVAASLVVSYASGAFLCNRKITQHAQHDHNSIAKPSSASDSVHVEFLHALTTR